MNVMQTVKCGHLLVSCGIIFKNASMCIFLEGHGHDFKKSDNHFSILKDSKIVWVNLFPHDSARI